MKIVIRLTGHRSPAFQRFIAAMVGSQMSVEDFGGSQQHRSVELVRDRVTSEFVSNLKDELVRVQEHLVGSGPYVEVFVRDFLIECGFRLPDEDGHFEYFDRLSQFTMLKPVPFHLAP